MSDNSKMLPAAEWTTVCPHCGYLADAHTDVGSGPGDEPRMPELGDRAICFNCGGISEYDNHRRLARVNANAEFSEDEMTLAALIVARGRVE